MIAPTFGMLSLIGLQALAQSIASFMHLTSNSVMISTFVGEWGPAASSADGVAERSPSRAAAQMKPFGFIPNRKRAAVTCMALVYARHGRECGGASPL